MMYFTCIIYYRYHLIKFLDKLLIANAHDPGIMKSKTTRFKRPIITAKMMHVTKDIEIKGFLQTVRHEMISRFSDRAAFAKFRAIVINK